MVEIWRCAIIKSSAQTILNPDEMAAAEFVLLPDAGPLRFYADPFGIWQNDQFFVFVEKYDYRHRKGVIDLFIYDQNLKLLSHKNILTEPWHLSWPYIFPHKDEIYMLPEAYKSGKTTLYKATDFPHKWEAVSDFKFPDPTIDPVLFYYQHKFYMLWTPSTPKEARQRDLHLSSADDLFGQWHHHGCIYSNKEGGRPAGRVWIEDDEICLPVQDCSQTYGGGVRILRLTDLEDCPTAFLEGDIIPPPALKKDYPDGMHTFSSAGPVTLIDVRYDKRSFHAFMYKLFLKIKRFIRD